MTLGKNVCIHCTIQLGIDPKKNSGLGKYDLIHAADSELVFYGAQQQLMSAYVNVKLIKQL